MQFWSLITDVGILLSACLILGSLFMRIGISPLLGYLFAGMLLGGDGSLNLIRSPEEIETISELGVSLLLFSLGLEFSWKEILRFKSNTLSAAALQVLLTPIFTIAICQFFSIPLQVSLILGLMLTLSSTATVLRTLQDQGEIDSNYGRNATATLLIQDIAVVPFSIIVSILATGDQGFNFNNVVSILGGSLALVVVLYILLDRLFLRAIGLLIMDTNRDMAMLLAVITGIGSAWAAHLIGISPAMGAFIAGMFLGNSYFATQIRADIASWRVVLLTLFFGSVGMLADGSWILDHWFIVLILALVVVFFKTIITTIIFLFSRNTLAISATTAICLSQVGEFAFVLSNQASVLELIDLDTYQLIISVTIMTLFITPFAIKLAPRIGLRIQKIFGISELNNNVYSQQSSLEQAEIFVLGFGPAGVEVARRLKDRKFNPVIIDLNSESRKKVEAMGLRSYVGDVRQMEVLEHFGLRNAKLVVITIPSFDASLVAINNIRKLAPEAYLIVRSRYQAHKPGFETSGADLVINEEFTVGDKLAKATMGYLRSRS